MTAGLHRLPKFESPGEIKDFVHRKRKAIQFWKHCGEATFAGEIGQLEADISNAQMILENWRDEDA